MICGPVLGIHLLGERRRADDVGEQRGHGLALAGQLRRRASSRRAAPGPPQRGVPGASVGSRDPVASDCPQFMQNLASAGTGASQRGQLKPDRLDRHLTAILPTRVTAPEQGVHSRLRWRPQSRSHSRRLTSGSICRESARTSSTLADSTITKSVFEPGMHCPQITLEGKPMCLAHHSGYCIDGALHVQMEDGSTLDVAPNDVFDRGREIKTAGDGFIAGFDGAGRAIAAAVAIRDRALADGLSIRAGVHSGEVELVGDDVAGVTVHEAARVVAAAGRDEILVSEATRLLASGAPHAFEARGPYELKGLPGARTLYAVETKPDPVAGAHPG